MQGPENIRTSIRRARWREFGTRSLRVLTYALPIYAFLATLVALLHHFMPAALPVLLQLLVAAAIVGLLICVAYGLAGLSIWRMAGLLDRRGVLKDRLSNALEFSRRDQRTPLMELAIDDAAEIAARLQTRALVPLWSKANSKRLAALIFLLPLLYAAAVVNLADLFGPREEPAPITGMVTPTIPDELADGGFRDLPDSARLLPAVTGLRGLIGSWRERLAELRERARVALQREPDEEPVLPEIIYPEDTGPTRAGDQAQAIAIDGLPAVRPDDRMHLSDLAGLGNVDAEIDENLRMAFAELDQDLVYEDPNIAEVENYFERLERQAQRGYQAGGSQYAASQFGGQMSADGDPQGALRNATQGAQQQSFNEFLHEYAEHLGRLVEEKKKVNEQRRGQVQGQAN
ncbi:MAG: hypothetical protein ACTSXZ_04035, partial [Alphaproteobacteria bacterium]